MYILPQSAHLSILTSATAWDHSHEKEEMMATQTAPSSLGKPYTREQCVSILTQMWDNVQSDVSIFPMAKASCLSAEHTHRAFSINCEDLQDEGNQSNIQAISLGSLKTQTWNVAFAMRGTANNPSEAGEKDWYAYSRKMQQVEVIWARQKMGSISCMDKVHPPLYVCKCCCNDALQVPTGSEMSENPAAVPVCAIYYLSHQPIRNENLLHISKQRRACPLSAINDSMILPVSIANSHVHTTRWMRVSLMD